jgi:hypothetical protein
MPDYDDGLCPNCGEPEADCWCDEFEDDEDWDDEDWYEW